MASLKEVKGRIATVNNTRKITSAMKMVASAKLHKAQGAITNMLPYERRLHGLLTNLLGDSEVLVWNTPREVKRVALVVFSSNSSLCGGFNANVIKHATQWLDEYQALGKDNILIYPVGKKVADALSKMGYAIQGNFQHLADKPSFAEAAELAQGLMNLFTRGEVDRVELLYNHFKNTASQILTREVYLPFTSYHPEEHSDEGSRKRQEEIDYILEHSREELLAMQAELEVRYAEFAARNLKLDMSRGKPEPAQLDLAEEL